MSEVYLPHYFLHVRNGWPTEDPEGADFTDLEAARMEAIGAARELLSEAILAGNLLLEHKIEIADEAGRVLLTVPFREAVRERH